MKRKEYKEKGYKNKFGNSRVSNTYSTNKTHTHTHTRAHKMQSQRIPEKFKFFRDCVFFEFFT